MTLAKTPASLGNEIVYTNNFSDTKSMNVTERETNLNKHDLYGCQIKVWVI